MRMLYALLATALLLSMQQASGAELVTRKSAHSVSVTVDKLAAAVEKAGATVFARIDHAAGATSVGMELRPTQVLIFGNPKLGTPALQASQTSVLDLPLRVVAYEDASGQAFLAYHPRSKLSEDHGIPADAEALKKMTGALNNLTNAATAPYGHARQNVLLTGATLSTTGCCPRRWEIRVRADLYGPTC